MKDIVLEFINTTFRKLPRRIQRDSTYKVNRLFVPNPHWILIFGVPRSGPPHQSRDPYPDQGVIIELVKNLKYRQNKCWIFKAKSITFLYSGFKLINVKIFCKNETWKTDLLTLRKSSPRSGSAFTFKTKYPNPHYVDTDLKSLYLPTETKILWIEEIYIFHEELAGFNLKWEFNVSGGHNQHSLCLLWCIQRPWQNR